MIRKEGSLSGIVKFFRTKTNLTNIAKVCRIMLNFVELVEFCRTCRTLSNYVELCRTCRTLSNYAELVELCRIMSNFVWIFVIVLLDTCLTGLIGHRLSFIMSLMSGLLALEVLFHLIVEGDVNNQFGTLYYIHLY